MSVKRALEWLEEAELPTGGIACWQDENGHFHQAYPEVTGYLIPTMLAYGLDDLAVRCADWLVSIQCDDGAFCGMDGVKRTFDTSAVMEGLTATGSDVYYPARELAGGWLRKQRLDNGQLRIFPGTDDTHVYTVRAIWAIYDTIAAAYWLTSSGWDSRWGEKQRPHYIAYALDSLDRMNNKKTVKTVLEASQNQPLNQGLIQLWSYGWSKGDGFCTTSTLQFAILYRRYGMPYKHLIEAAEKMQSPNGGIMHGADDGRLISWALKFYLDAKHAYYTI